MLQRLVTHRQDISGDVVNSVAQIQAGLDIGWPKCKVRQSKPAVTSVECPNRMRQSYARSSALIVIDDCES